MAFGYHLQYSFVFLNSLYKKKSDSHLFGKLKVCFFGGGVLYLFGELSVLPTLLNVYSPTLLLQVIHIQPAVGFFLFLFS